MWQRKRSARWTCWLNSWLAGHASTDEARDAAVGDDAAHDVLGLSDEGTQPLVLAWGQFRSRGTTAARLVLPQPGDLHGLGGPPLFNEASLDAGEAVILLGSGLGAVPEVVGGGVFWHLFEARPPPGNDQVPDAERALREALVTLSQDLDEQDLELWQPEIRLAFSEVREDVADPLAPGYTPRASRLAVLANRCLAICELAETESSASVSWASRERLAQNLSVLGRSARHGLVAACSEGLQR